MTYKRYIIAFIVTLSLFALAFYLSQQLASRKVDQIRMIQDKISTDILSTETRFILLGSSSCKNLETNDEFETSLSGELSEMARRVKFMESQLGYNDENVLLIKNQYALMQIKDYVLQKQLADRCGEKIKTVLYFHSLECDDCKEQSIVLDEIHDKYPNVRIYWFDADSSTPALGTLRSMFKVTQTPTIIIEDKKYEGLQTLEKLIPMFDKFTKTKKVSN